MIISGILCDDGPVKKALTELFNKLKHKFSTII